MCGDGDMISLFIMVKCGGLGLATADDTHDLLFADADEV